MFAHCGGTGAGRDYVVHDGILPYQEAVPDCAWIAIDQRGPEFLTDNFADIDGSVVTE